MMFLAGVMLASVVFGDNPQCHDDKVPICHVPPGNPINVQNICIDESAWEDPHAKHGDTKGFCPSEIICGPPVQVAPGTLEMQVDAVGFKMTGPFLVFALGPVIMEEFTCAPANETKWSCNYQGSGDTGYEGEQKLVVQFNQEYGDSVECEMGGEFGGLPVELNSFSVE